jgi:hypothetical protein
LYYSYFVEKQRTKLASLSHTYFQYSSFKFIFLSNNIISILCKFKMQQWFYLPYMFENFHRAKTSILYMQNKNKHFLVAEVSTEEAKQSVFHAISPGTAGKLLGFKCEAKCAFPDCAALFCELVPATSSRGGAPLIHACLRNSSKIDTDRERAPFSAGNRREIENFPCVRKVLTSPPAAGVSAKEREIFE